MFDFLSDEAFRSIETIWTLLAIIAVSLLVLGKGADYLVENAAKIATDLGIGKLIIGATIVSLGTTTPEAAVSVYAAWTGNADLALGNAVGSIICDTGLIFGIACLLSTIPIDRSLVNRQGWIQFGAGLLLAFLCYVTLFSSGGDPEKITLERWVGVFLSGLLIAYLYFSLRWAKAQRSEDETSKQVIAIDYYKFFIQVALLLGGLLMVLISSRVLIGSVTEVAYRWEVPDAIIAATLVAFGTSLPELVTAIAGVLKGQKEIVLGNIIGADILNVLFVVGLSAVAAPLPIEKSFFIIHLPVMVGILALFRIFIFVSKNEFSRWMGIPFLAIYIAYVVTQYSAPIH